MKNGVTMEEFKRLSQEAVVDEETDLYAKELAIAMSSSDWKDDYEAFDKSFELRHAKEHFL